MPFFRAIHSPFSQAVWSASPQDVPAPVSSALGLQAPCFSSGCWGQNSDLHAWAPGCLLTEQSPQALKKIF